MAEEVGTGRGLEAEVSDAFVRAVLSGRTACLEDEIMRATGLTEAFWALA
jgi:hypothetical protein